MSQLSTCGCCQGISPETPVQLFNRPGLNAIAYRVGIYPEFRESLLSALSNKRLPALNGLKTRSNDDFSIALLDAWAVVSDVLTFYQERIANESYLRTATERYSILQMARLIGYELRPGVAAQTYLAFTLDKTAGAVPPIFTTIADLTPDSPTATVTSSITIDTGVKVQSVPGPDEFPQVYETIELTEARPEWNEIRPRIFHPQPVEATNNSFVLKGIVNDIKKGDVILISTSADNHSLKRVLNVITNSLADITRIDLTGATWHPSFDDTMPDPDGNINFISQTVLNDAAVASLLNYTWKEEDLAVLLELKKWSLNDVLKGVKKELFRQENPEGKAVHVFRKTVHPFAYNAPKEIDLNGNNRPVSPLQWIELSLHETCSVIYLDNEYKEILAGSYIGVVKQDVDLDSARIFKITGASIGSRAEYGVSGKTTKLGIPNTQGPCWFDNVSPNDFSLIRDISFFVQNEKLDLAYLSNERIVEEDKIILDRWYPGLKKGKKIILSGHRDDLKGTFASEVMTLDKVYVKKGYTVIKFTEKLLYRYIRSTVVINANVAAATHGETVRETLGSGDAGKAFQQFILKQSPLTYTSAASATGGESTLKVYVNDVLWHEVDSFFGHTPAERIYITRMDNDGKTAVIFGDGITGSRLPTGTENVRAVYRKGTGLGGLVKAKQLSQLITRPLGVKEGINPLESTGAADAERLDEARNNAPLTLLTMDRVVSLQDYEDFARAFSGIEKALATWAWKDHKQWIFLTVAGANGAVVNNVLSEKLLKAIRQFGDPRANVEIKSYQPLFFRVTANIKIDSDYLAEKVIPEIEKDLRNAFSFRARSFGQPVAISEVTMICQKVKGVIAVDIDDLHYSNGTKQAGKLLEASVPLTGEAAELLTLDPGPINIRDIL